MQCACAILSSVACPALQYFYKFSHKGNDFRKKSYLTKIYVLRFLLDILSEIFLTLRRIERDVIKNVYYTSCIVPVILVTF